jgi:hypothetical protein
MNDSKRSFPSWLPLASLLVGAVAVMLLLWFLVIKAENDVGRDGPEVVEASDLSDAADRAGHPVYWAGEREGKKIELAESDDGRVYVRYLDENAEAGVRSTKFMTVATYPTDDAVAALRRGAKRLPNAELARGDDGSVVLIDPSTPGSVRIAHPGSDEQIEFYTPNIRESIRLATDGSIQPVP